MLSPLINSLCSRPVNRKQELEGVRVECKGLGCGGGGVRGEGIRVSGSGAKCVVGTPGTGRLNSGLKVLEV